MKSLPRKIGRYTAVQLIGRGGSGAVYLCIDESLNRTVAIKVLASSAQQDQARFTHEARFAAQLSHPNVAAIYDVGTSDGESYVVQEYVAGHDLGRVIRSNQPRLAQPVAIGLLRQVAHALAYAHSKSILHRDIKPGNVMVQSDGTAKLLDFGLATMAGRPNDITIIGSALGTPAYMSPEAISSEATDARSDIYSFGVLAFELLSGNKPFTGDSFFELATAVVNGPRPSLASLSDFPLPLVQLVDACMAFSPDARPDSMTAVAQLIEPFEAAWDPGVFHRCAEADEVLAPRLDAGDDHTGGFVPMRPPPAAPGDGSNAWNSEITLVLPPRPRSSAMLREPRPSSNAADVTPQPTDDRTVGSERTANPGPNFARGTDLSGKTVGRFVLHEHIARGHSGDIYKGWDPVRGELVAIKVVDLAGEDATQRLMRGARIWIKLRHPNIVSVLEVHPDYGGHAGVIVYEMIGGTNLEDLLRERHLSVAQIVSVMLQVCDALATLHALGVVHREVKPRNILVSGTGLHTTLLDSGIARHANPEVDAFTRTGFFVGDLAYAAPEQAKGQVDQRTDIYAVVAVLYEAMTRSRIPFPAPLSWQPDAELLRTVPARLRDVLFRGLQRDPKARFGSIAELHDQLRPFAPVLRVASRGPAVIALHGIRTQAAWQRAFAEVCAAGGMSPHVDRWNFGYFSALRFLSPWSRLAKVRWFRETYQREFRDVGGDTHKPPPSIVAHSFGTYILGNALLRYPYLRFDKVILCGSILPTGFPWDRLIDRGQVQSVRNEYGREDFWTMAVGWFVPATGPSGLVGFQCSHPRLFQERFEFEHSEYFDRGHMEHRWMPHLTAKIDERPLEATDIPSPAGDHRPWGLYGLILVSVLAFGLAIQRAAA